VTGFLALVFFLSGASALVFETLWFRQAGLALGNNVWASSVVLSSFMGGLALGNALGAGRLGRLTRPLRAYAVLETLIAVTGAGLVFVLPGLTGAIASLPRSLLDRPLLLNLVRLLVAFACLLVPAAAMGLTLPLVVRASTARAAVFGRTLGLLYGLNTLGAVFGALGTEVVLIRFLGVRGSALGAGSLNLVAASVALLLSLRNERAPAARLSRDTGPTPRVAAPLATAPGRIPGTWRRLAAAFLTGAILLGLEVVWFRFLSMFVAGTGRSFAVMLSVVLLGIGAGGLAASAWLRRDATAPRHLHAMALLGGVLVVVTYAMFQGANGGDLVRIAPDGATAFLLALRLMFPVSFLSGALFTWLGQSLYRGEGTESRTVGLLTLANTIGAALGSLAGGFLLLPVLGMERSFFALALLYGMVALLLPNWRQASRLVLGAALAAFVLLVAFFPFGLMEGRYLAALGRRFGGDGARIVAVREGLTETVLYLRSDYATRPPVFRLVTNGFSMSGTTLAARRYMKLYVYWPAAVRPDLRHALLISYGIGETAKALTDTARLETIDVVDISRDILEMSRIVHPQAGTHPLDDPRVRVHVEDGRQFLETTDRRFDLITAEPPPPRNAGVVNLYTFEYFRLLRDRLTPGGVVTYWLPVDQLLVSDARSVIRGFCDAFTDCSLWGGAGFNWMLVGTRDLASAPSADAFSGPWRDPRVGPEMARRGFERPEQLGALFIGDAAYLRGLVADAPPLVDDFPQRIAHPVGRLDWRLSERPVFERWMDAGEARARFETSPFVASLWPDELRRATPPFFRFQGQVDRGMIANAWWNPPRTAGLSELHDVLTQSSLRTLALWWLGTTAEEQETAARLEARGGAGLDGLLGLGALADRAYDRAAERFAHANPGSAPDPADGYREIYALCLAGRFADARARGAVLRARADRRDDGEFWRWLQAEFGVR
jgi:spermidine synthase